jgi:hypothetical protein
MSSCSPRYVWGLLGWKPVSQTIRLGINTEKGAWIEINAAGNWSSTNFSSYNEGFFLTFKFSTFMCNRACRCMLLVRGHRTTKIKIDNHLINLGF